MSRRRSMEVIEGAEYVTIGELARLTGVRYSTLKFYTEEGLLNFEQAEENLTRRYRRAETMARIERIKALREQGKTIPEVNALLTCFYKNPLFKWTLKTGFYDIFCF